MNTNHEQHSQSILTASIFGVIGFALMISVIILHSYINDHPTLAQSESDITTLSVAPPNPIPDELVSYITNNPRNLVSEAQLKTTKPLPPAMQFLHDLGSTDLFLTQD